jgi:hypothetical protein
VPSTRSSSAAANAATLPLAYIERRIAEGKSPRESARCLKRYTARNLYRRLNAIANTP